MSAWFEACSVVNSLKKNFQSKSSTETAIWPRSNPDHHCSSNLGHGISVGRKQKRARSSSDHACRVAMRSGNTIEEARRCIAMEGEELWQCAGSAVWWKMALRGAVEVATSGSAVKVPMSGNVVGDVS
jgi:hypothetical protein